MFTVCGCSQSMLKPAAGWPLVCAKEAAPHAVLPHIDHGYPKVRSIGDCFMSVFWLHNETVNVWSHLIGFCAFVVLMVLTAQQISSKPSTDQAALMLFFLCACGCFLLSALYHMLKAHTYSTYRVAITLDYVGIFVMILGSFLSGLHFEFYCDPQWRVLYQTGIASLCLAGGLLTFAPQFDNPKCQRLRVGCYVATVAFSLVPICHVVLLGQWERTLKWLVLLAVYGAGAWVYSTRFPESYYPGRFDILLASHQLWHISVLLAAAWQYHLLSLLQAEVVALPCAAR